MKVAFCAYDGPGTINGPGSWLRRLAPALAAGGVEPTVLCALRGETGPLVDGLRRDGIEVRTCPWPVGTKTLVRWLLTEVASARPSVFVPNIMVAGYIASRWIAAAGIPTVGVLHSDDDFHWALVERFVTGPRVWRLTDVACVSEFLYRAVAARATKDTRAWYRPHGVLVPTESALRPQGRFRLIYVGRLVERQKRILEVARAMLNVTLAIPGTEAIIVGDGPERAQVERLLSDDNARARVRLAGPLDLAEVQRELLEAHAMLLLSDYEGLPLALLEAMAVGVVPICRPARSGVGEVVEDGVSGFLVGADGGGLVEKVRLLYDDPELWMRLSASARERVAQHYSAAEANKGWCSMLIDLGERSRGSRGPSNPRLLQLPRFHPDLAREDLRPRGLPRRVGARMLRWLTARR